ncbi:MAG: sulfotransferase [Oceanipulchritudo sp.]
MNKSLSRRVFNGLNLVLNRVLAWSIDSLQPAINGFGDWRPIFILGAPRCGSTLVYQTITSSLKIGFPSNRHNRFYGAPGFAERCLLKPCEQEPSRYQSNFGRTNEPWEPSEFTNWWYRFFRRSPPHCGFEDVNPRKMRAFRRSLLHMTAAFEKPVLFKNLYTSVRLEPVVETIPEALFVVVRRDEIRNAHSLLEARKTSFGNYLQWFSLPPPEINSLLQRPPEQQVVLQIRAIYREIERSLVHSGHPRDRTMEVDYDEFCHNPALGICRFQQFVEKHGYCLEETGHKPPEQFSTSGGVRIDGDLFSRLQAFSRTSNEWQPDSTGSFQNGPEATFQKQ